MPNRYLLEILAYDVEACIIAAAAGADRIELCDNAQHGGTTPSYGVIKSSVESVQIPVFTMIRPRGGNFVYSQKEFEVMQTDIRVCKSLGASGVVLGLLNSNGTVDQQRTAKLVELAYPMDVTFHRAFDYTVEPFEALQAIVDCGCTRILTSGQQRTAALGASLIRELIEVAESEIIIMPGSGVRSDNIIAIQELTAAQEFHSSAGVQIQHSNLYNQSEMPEPEALYLPDPVNISAMKALLVGL